MGAGPGGATAAYFLGEAGLRVLVIEKENLPVFAATEIASALAGLFGGPRRKREVRSAVYSGAGD